MSSDKSDKKLYLKIREKDKEAYMEAYDKYLDDIYRFVYFKVNNREEAEDITSQTFLKTWDYIQNNEVKDYKTLKALIYHVARNLVIDYYRKQSTRKSAVQESDISEFNIIDEAENLQANIELKDDCELVAKKLLELKDEYREVIILKYVNGLSIAEIASATGKNRGNIRIITYRAIKALRDLIGDQK